MTEEARARNGYAASKDPEYGDPWLLRFTNGQSTKIADFHYHDDCEFVARALNDHFEPQQRESWGALRFMLQEALAERDKLAAKNARLREAIRATLAEWWQGQEMFLSHGFWSGAPPDLMDYCIVPAHIVALQEAIYREGGE